MERADLLEKARRLAALEKRYDEAIAVLKEFLKTDSNDIDAWRLEGNILELKASDMQENGSDNSMMSREDARTCYEKILQLDPENTVAHIDLGDYWEQKGDYDTALKLYNRAITLLKRGVFYNSYAEECEEAFWSKSELLKTVGKTDEYYLCIAEGLRLCPESELLKTDPDKRAFCKGC